eukprot:6254864-Pyramimonas_sp.AAC.2
MVCLIAPATNNSDVKGGVVSGAVSHLSAACHTARKVHAAAAGNRSTIAMCEYDTSSCVHGPIRCRKRGYILTTDQSDAGNPATGLDTDTVELIAKTLLSHLVTLERIQFSHQLFTDAICPCRALVTACVSAVPFP